MICFGKRENLNPRYIGPFEILTRIGPVAYKLQLPPELYNVHLVFHVSSMKKCIFDMTLVVSIDEIEINKNLHFVEELVQIMAREVKRTKQSRVPIVKIRWSAK